MTRQQHLNFDKRPGCVQCGRTENVYPGEPGLTDRVTWRCCRCDGLICRECCLRMPENHPDKTTGLAEYYQDTYCSERCRVIEVGTQQLKRRG